MPQRELSADVSDAVDYLTRLVDDSSLHDPERIDHARRTLQACWGSVPQPTAPSYGPPEYSE